MTDAGYDRPVAVLTQPLGYRKGRNPLMPMIERVYKRYPDFVAAAGRRHEMYNAELDFVAAEERAGRLLVIRPKEKLPVGRIEKDPGKLRAAYEAGRAAAEERLEEIREYLG